MSPVREPCLDLQLFHVRGYGIYFVYEYRMISIRYGAVRMLYYVLMFLSRLSCIFLQSRDLSK